jgi:hypothetical protein
LRIARKKMKVLDAILRHTEKKGKTRHGPPQVAILPGVTNYEMPGPGLVDTAMAFLEGAERKQPACDTRSRRLGP